MSIKGWLQHHQTQLSQPWRGMQLLWILPLLASASAVPLSQVCKRLWWWRHNNTTVLWWGPFIWQHRDSMVIVHSPLPLNDDPWRVSAITKPSKTIMISYASFYCTDVFCRAFHIFHSGGNTFMGEDLQWHIPLFWGRQIMVVFGKLDSSGWTMDSNLTQNLKIITFFAS